ncbi:hypothetical protein [Noviherbaspirillum autotrophicum]|uniref:Transmembrane protein n=1 Tax=Noviherbaspirillum autotrophicum TaxID=709839 RepID=A0A0C2BJA0_9BURK|nr:hypothetical protein [Noviherbaspirillum autotrophicum]KIF80069.1 hypothetical protein TSA66_03375 [Noviherbaspirillum autotrophicum]HJW57259.1 hypothetical protein [Burkholderiaceae bacterium]
MHTYPDAALFEPQAPRTVRPLRLWFGLLAAPVAWMLDDMLSYYIASLECRIRPSGDAPLYAGTLWFWVVLIASLAVASAGTWVAVGNWRRTRSSQPSATHAQPWRHDGHRRFVATASVLSSIGFLTAFVFMVFNVAFAPICGF